MKAKVTKARSEPQEFTTWIDLEKYFTSDQQGENLVYQIEFSLYLGQKHSQYELTITGPASVLQVITMLKSIESRVGEIWDKYLDALPGDDSDW